MRVAFSALLRACSLTSVATQGFGKNKCSGMPSASAQCIWPIDIGFAMMQSAWNGSQFWSSGSASVHALTVARMIWRMTVSCVDVFCTSRAILSSVGMWREKDGPQPAICRALPFIG